MEAYYSSSEIPRINTFDKNEFKSIFDEFLGYVILNHCVCVDDCKITGDGDTVREFNVYMNNIRSNIWKDLVQGDKDILGGYAKCSRINTKYIYDMKDRRVSNVQINKIENVIKYMNEFLVEYGILRKKYDDYYIMNSSRLFTWSDVHSLSTGDVIKYIRMKKGGIIDRNRSIVSTMVQLVSGINVDILEGEESVEALMKDEYKVIYEKYIGILRCMMWLFRKMVVDSIVSDSINEVVKSGSVSKEKKESKSFLEVPTSLPKIKRRSILETRDIDAISVGSTKLISDYDVTLYGNFKLMSEVIKRFNDSISKLFGGENSEVLFDTNVYGISFMKLMGRNIFSIDEDMRLYSMTRECRDQKFMYILGESEEVRDTQHMWAFMKVLRSLKKIESFDRKLFAELYKYMEMNLRVGDHFRKAQSFSIFLRKRGDYASVLNSYNDIIEKLSDMDRILLTNNYISLVNYYGSETYYTRGAFLDVVINQQMCGGGIKRCVRRVLKMPGWMVGRRVEKVYPVEEDKVILSESEYMDSFIENIAELMIHYDKGKYVDRCENALSHLGEKYSKESVCKVLRDIREMQKKCSEDIKRCGVYMLESMLVRILVLVYNEYMEGRDSGSVSRNLDVIGRMRGVM
jgi:hypothetical protein